MKLNFLIAMFYKRFSKINHIDIFFGNLPNLSLGRIILFKTLNIFYDG